jgi:serine/threonine-protein kinase
MNANGNIKIEPPINVDSCGWDYELIEMVWKDAVGDFYKARQISQNRLVAVKLLPLKMVVDRRVRAFRAEAEAAVSLHHPNIIKVFEVGEFKGQPFYSLEWIEGQRLQQRLSEFCVPDRYSTEGANRETARQQQIKIVKLLAKVARAVQYIHQRGLIAKGLRPELILLDQNGEPHLGPCFSVPQPDDDSDSDILCMGIPPDLTASPENDDPWTVAADIYRLGKIMYLLLTGRHAFPDSAGQTIRQVIQGKPQRPRAINPRIDRDLETICMNCLASDPAKRYVSAEALAGDLEWWLRGDPRWPWWWIWRCRIQGYIRRIVRAFPESINSGK